MRKNDIGLPLSASRAAPSKSVKNRFLAFLILAVLAAGIYGVSSFESWQLTNTPEAAPRLADGGNTKPSGG